MRTLENGKQSKSLWHVLVLIGILMAGFGLSVSADSSWTNNANELLPPFCSEGGKRTESSLVAAVTLASDMPVHTLTPLLLDASGSYSASGSIATYDWDFNSDGMIDVRTTEPRVYATFDTDGLQLVTVRVADVTGAYADSTPLELDVLNQAPEASFSISTTAPTDGEVVRFLDASTDPDGEIVDWRWDFGDGTVGTGAAPTHTYTDAGTYTVSLAVEDEDGACGQPHTEEIVVGNAAPVALFTMSCSATCVGTEVTFFDESTDPSLDGEIVHIAWAYGDGSYDAGSPVEDGEYSHTYAEPGTYTVTFYAIDQDGGLSVARATIHVRA